MDILVTFEDGTSELRAANSHVFGARPNKHPRAVWVNGHGTFTLGLPGYAHETRSVQLRDVHRFGVSEWWAYRLTGGFGEGERLKGRWEPCRVEATDEQIDRLARERDAARRVAEETDRRIGLLDTLADDHEAGKIRPEGLDVDPRIARSVDVTTASVLRMAVRILRGRR